MLNKQAHLPLKCLLPKGAKAHSCWASRVWGQEGALHRARGVDRSTDAGHESAEDSSDHWALTVHQGLLWAL